MQRPKNSGRIFCTASVPERQNGMIGMGSIEGLRELQDESPDVEIVRHHGMSVSSKKIYRWVKSCQNTGESN